MRMNDLQRKPKLEAERQHVSPALVLAAHLQHRHFRLARIRRTSGGNGCNASAVCLRGCGTDSDGNQSSYLDGEIQEDRA